MKLKKIVSIILLILILVNSMSGIANAFEVNSAYVENLGDCGQHLQFKTTSGIWSYVITTMVGYRNNGVLHYAYCLNVDKHGVGEEQNYSVNVTEILSDVQVWRAIVNGFPYKSASELGVENDQDAFVATKQAVYSVIYNRDVDSFYRGGDARGTKIFNAIKNIVNQARYGSETPSANSVLNANKIGGFKADGSNYYSQEYSVTSNVNVSNYTVTSISNFPEGSYIADLSGNAKTTFSGNEHFKVVVPKDKILDNFDGKISLNGKVKSYPVFFGQSPNPNWQNYALTYDAYYTAGGETTLSVDAYKSKIKVIKIDNETKKSIAGVEFNFRYSDGQNIGNYKTDSQGCIELSKLKQGKVIATEIATKSEYILDDKENEILLDYDTYKELTIGNEHKRGDLSVYKVDADNKKITLGGVEFALYSHEFQKITGHYTTDANGEIHIKGLRTGEWSLIEEKTGKWYNLNENPIEIKINWNEITNTTVENELKKSQIKIIKVDKENHEVKLKDVELEVLDKDGNVLEKLKTDKNGECYTKRYAVRDYPELYIRETKTNEKYVLDTEMKKIILKENEIVNYTFENQKIYGQIKVIKTSEEDNKINGDKKGTPIPNVSFGVYDENKNFIEKITTGADGIAITSKLEKGKKYIKELEGESGEWYQLNENEYSAEIVKHGEIVELNITNKPDNPDIDVEKDGIIQTTANQEIKYDFTIKNILTNPKYKGCYCGKKTEVIDFMSKERIEIPKEEWITYKAEENIVPQIVNDDIWQKCNEIMEKRSNKYTGTGDRWNNQYQYSNLLICTNDGKKFWRRKHRPTAKEEFWICSEYAKNGLKNCNNHTYIGTEELNSILSEFFSELLEKKSMILKEMLKANSRLDKKDFKLEKNIKILENAINEKEKNKANLIKLYTMNKITDDEFEKIKNEYQDEIMDYKSQLIQLKVNRDANETGKNQQKIKKFFDFDTFELTKEFIHEKIDRIYVQGIEKNHVKLKINFHLGLEMSEVDKKSICLGLIICIEGAFALSFTPNLEPCLTISGSSNINSSIEGVTIP